MKLFLSLLLLTSSTWAKESFIDSVKRMKWGETEVVWIEDDKFPKFTVSLYFQGGALNDAHSGLTEATFDQLTAGTSKENQKQLAEFFDFYGANVKHTVTHEYSIMSVQALTRDIEPVMGKVCELFRDAQYPAEELSSYISRSKSHLKNLVTSHASLADRIFRHVSLQGTPFALPADGTLESFKHFTPELLKTRLKELSATKKVLYLAGPSDVKKMEKVITKSCPWTSKNVLPELTLKKPDPKSKIYLVPVPGANQAQIRIGRYLTKSEVEGKHDHFQFLAGFMGGSFTSKLVQELRVKRGLTYSAGAYVSMQRDYGRTGIMTFSKTETAAETIALIRDVFADVAAGKVTDKEFKHQQGHQIGSYSFGFEETGAFIGQLMLYDHQGRPLQDLVKYPETISKLKVANLAQADAEAFQWDRMTIVVVGDAALEKSLSKIRPVEILKYQDFL